MIVSIIAAMSENRIIGRGGDLPWCLPADLARFKALTTGHMIIMGRKTFDSIGKPLPGRKSIVVTRNPDYHPGGVHVARSIEQAIGDSASEKEIFIVGGGEIYRQALPIVGKMYLTIVHATIEGDTYFPKFDERDWRLVDDEHHEADDHHTHAFSFQRYERVSDPDS